MINEKNYSLGAQPSAIRELFAYGLERKSQIGEDKVFDFSLGNPSVPSPSKVSETIEKISKMPPEKVHGYTPAQGLPSCRKAIADNLNERFGTNYTPDNLYMTMGAAASLDASLHAVLNPGDEVIVIAPYFPEYKMWIESAGSKCVEVAARQSDFQIDIDAVNASINSRTRAIIVNSPNNPVGTVYTRENLEELADVLVKRSGEFGEPIYLISDEPYRELVYDGVVPSWMPDIYNDTIVCYSWSKSLSMPGERIGYVLVPDCVTDARRVYTAICGAGRALGYVCAPVLFQMVIEECVGEPADVASYTENRELLCSMLSEIGYEYIEPQGAFYLWVKVLEPDAEKFAERAKSHELLLVPSNSFGVKGWVRIGYCVSKDVIVNSRQAFEALMADYR